MYYLPFGLGGRLQEELLRIQRGVKKTILFVTHDVEEAFKLGEQIVVLSEGELQQEGTPIELLSHPANDFVRQLVGADNTLRQLEYLPVRLAIEPGVEDASAEAIEDGASLLQALLRLIQTGASELRVERAGQSIGRITLSSIYAGLQVGRERPLSSAAAQ